MEIITFADDTVALFYGDSWEVVNKMAQNGFNQINKWLSSNLLTLNISKTKYMAFSIKNNRQSLCKNISIKIHSCQRSTDPNCSCQSITEALYIRYLGVLLDNNLSWREHILNLSGKVRKLIYVFKNLRHICEKKLLISLYFALCQAITTYCITAWGAATKTTMLKLERAQRAVLKVMTFNSFRYPTHTLYRDTSVLTVRQLFIKLVILKQHKCIPNYPTTRRRNDFVYSTPIHKTKFAKKFINVLGPILYNKLSKDIDLRSLNLHTCKKTLHSYLQNISYENTEQLLKNMV